MRCPDAPYFTFKNGALWKKHKFKVDDISEHVSRLAPFVFNLLLYGRGVRSIFGL